ncbi:sugar diacid recognition domain-containing protein [Bacillus sp. FSL W8-0102]|uniref:CdaR family transcriptional regulator n=1 Tax=Bacillus sp. FSL W8-0102 TaxID=2978205 RepID=UPI0030FA77F3
MHLSTNLASKIISEVQQVMKEDIILVDTKGIIISSTEKSRIGTFHEGATIVIKTKKVLYIDQDKAKILKGVKAGINMPIMFNKQVIGVIGITGDPKKVEPFAELIRRMTELIIQEAYYTERNEWEIRGIESYLYEWINSTSVDKEFLERGVMLGIPVYDTHICALIQSEIQTLDHYDIPRIQKEIMELFYSVFGKENYFLIRWGQERFLLLKKIGSTFNKNHFHSQLKNFKL